MERKSGTDQKIGGVEVPFMELAEALHTLIMSPPNGEDGAPLPFIEVHLQVVDNNWDMYAGAWEELEDQRGFYGSALMSLSMSAGEERELAEDTAEMLIQAALKHEVEVMGGVSLDLSVATVKPSQIDISNGLIGSPFTNAEAETIACNIITICRLNVFDWWMKFSWESYRRLCTHEVTDSEKQYLDRFVADGLLGFEGGEYVVRNVFITTLHKFVRRDHEAQAAGR